MAKALSERLSTRQRDCLRLVASNHSTKEIAQLLNLSPNTVDGYISEARDILGASTRRDAARLFQVTDSKSDPQNWGGITSRVSPPDQSHESSGRVSEVSQGSAASYDGDGPAALVNVPILRDAFHWFRGDREHNSLSPQQRLLWIAVGSVMAAFLFLAAVTSIDTLTRLFTRHTL